MYNDLCFLLHHQREKIEVYKYNNFYNMEKMQIVKNAKFAK